MSDNSNLLRVATMLPMDPRHRQLLTDSAAEIDALTAELNKLQAALHWIGYRSSILDADASLLQSHARAVLEGQTDE